MEVLLLSVCGLVISVIALIQSLRRNNQGTRVEIIERKREDVVQDLKPELREVLKAMDEERRNK